MKTPAPTTRRPTSGQGSMQQPIKAAPKPAQHKPSQDPYRMPCGRLAVGPGDI